MLTWLGPFHEEPNLTSQRSLTAVVSQVRNSRDLPFSKILGRHFPTPDQLGRRQLVSFAVGDLPGLTIGTLYRDGRPESRGKSLLTTRTFRLDFNQQLVFRLGETPERQAAPVLPEEAYLMKGCWPPMARSAGIGLTLGTDPFGVLVPVTEILRWCYGSSSAMLQAVLSDELEDAVQQVQAKSAFAEGQYHLAFPPGFIQNDAHTLAWLATDDHARQAALHVDRSVMVNTRRSPESPVLSSPALLFPFSDTLDVQVLGRWISAAGPFRRKRFLVHQILKTSFVLPFEVSVPEQRRGQSPAELPGSEPQLRQRATPPAGGPYTTLVSDIEPRRPRKPVRLPGLTSQFSETTLLRHPVDAPAQPVVQPLNTPVPTGSFATGTGVDQASRAKRATLVHLPTQYRPERPVTTTGFELMRAVLLILEGRGWTITLLPLNNPGGSEARFQGWLRANGERIGCLVVHLSHQGVSSYLFEKERLDTNSAKEYGPLLVATRNDRQAAPEKDLTALLAGRVSRKTWLRVWPGWTLWLLPHSFSTAETFTEGILRKLKPDEL